MIDELLERTRSAWVKYDKYIWKEASDGAIYLKAADDAIPSVTDPMKDFGRIVVDAVNIGRMCMGEERGAYSADEIQDAILTFAGNYGLLGLMAGLPTTPDFLDYDHVYFHRNRILSTESMAREDYVRTFFPFGEPDLTLYEGGTAFLAGGDVPMQALAMTFADYPIPVNMSFQREYAERLDWLKKQFTDWAFILGGIFFYYEDYDHLDAGRKDFWQQSTAAFSSVAPTYHLELHEHPVVVWDFYSLMACIQMKFCFMMANEEHPMKMCRNCGMAFVADAPDDGYCSDKCRREHEAHFRQREHDE